MKLRPHLPIKIAQKHQKNSLKICSLLIADLLLQIAGKHPVISYSVHNILCVSAVCTVSATKAVRCL